MDSATVQGGVLGGPLGQQDLRLTLGELRRRLRAFPHEYLKDKSEETVGTYCRSLKEFERWFVLQGGTCRFRTDDLQGYKVHLVEERGLSQVSVSTYLTALRQFCRYLVSIGLLDENPAAAIKGNRRPTSHSRQTLTKEEARALLDAVDVSTLIGKRDMAVIHLMLFAGLSEIEIVRLDVRDLEYTLLGPQLRVQGKGRRVKDQAVPIDGPVMEQLADYFAARRPLRGTDPLFVSHGHRSDGERLNTRSLRGRVTKHLEAAGIRRLGVSPHSLTRTAPLLWLGAGMDLEEVQRRMRHGSIDPTQIHLYTAGRALRDLPKA